MGNDVDVEFLQLLRRVRRKLHGFDHATQVEIVDRLLYPRARRKGSFYRWWRRAKHQALARSGFYCVLR